MNERRTFSIRPGLRESVAEEGRKARERVKALLAEADRADALAAMMETPGGLALRELLERHVALWKEGECWDEPGPGKAVKLGEALRSRGLLRYLEGMKETAKAARDEAKRLANLVEQAVQDGRIPAVQEP